VSHSVLWIDDEWVSLPEQVEHLKAASMNVDCATSVQEGLCKLSAGNYKGILLDMILPWQSEPGLEVSSEVEERPFLGTEIVQKVADLPAENRPRIVVLTIARDTRLFKKLVKWKKMAIIDKILGKDPPVSFDDVTKACASAIGLAASQQTEENRNET
jgi:CheY-like chemotaxis protein